MIERQPETVARYLAEIDGCAPLVAEHRALLRPRAPASGRLGAKHGQCRAVPLWLPRVMGGPELSPHRLHGGGRGRQRARRLRRLARRQRGRHEPRGGYLAPAIARATGAERRSVMSPVRRAPSGRATPVEGGYRVTGRWPFGQASITRRAMTWCTSRLTARQGHAAGASAATCRCEACASSTPGTSRACAAAAVPISRPRTRSFRRPACMTSSTTPHVEACFTGMPPTLRCSPGASRPCHSASRAAHSTTSRSWHQAGCGWAVAQRCASARWCRTPTAVPRAHLRAGRAFLIDRMTNLMSSVGTKDELDARVGLRTACALAGETAATICDRLAALAGSVAIQESHPLERRVRDVQAAIKHIAMNPSYFAVAGRVGLGMDPGVSRI